MNGNKAAKPKTGEFGMFARMQHSGLTCLHCAQTANDFY